MSHHLSRWTSRKSHNPDATRDSSSLEPHLMSEDLPAPPTPTAPGAADSPKGEGQSQELVRLRHVNDKLERRLQEMVLGVKTDRNVQRATLNLLEDTVAAREAAEREIAERKRIEQALHDANMRKDEFLAMLAHELRNPLAAIHSAGQLLLSEGSDTTTRHQAAEILNRQAAHMVRQMDDLLDVSRISHGKIELRRELTDLVTVINHAIEAIRPLCERLGHDLTITLPPEPLYVHGDPTRLIQVFGNLLTNACKFTPKGGRIQLWVRQEGSDVVIRIHDNGIGIEGAELSRVFEIFAQVNRSVESGNEGLGLGLALVKKLVEMHGGSVAARSEGLGLGSEFVVCFPVRQGPARSEKTNIGRPPETTSRRILVVDDNKDVALAMSMLLKVSGHQVNSVHDGLAAIEATLSGEFEVILLDIGMPGLDGYETARRIRQQGQEGLILVALTGWGQVDDRRRSKEAGFDVHLVKPVDTQVLLELVGGPKQG